MMNFRALLIVVGALGVAPCRADDGRWIFSTGVDYTSGNYGEAKDTTIVTVPFTASYGKERWSATVTVPFVSVDGPGTIVPGGLGNGGPLGGLLGGADAASPISPTGGVSETGLGDVSLALSATPVVTSGGTQFSVTGRVKAPTADADRSLGTGEAAASIAGGVRQPIGSRAAVYGSVGYEQAFSGGGSGVIANAGAETYVSKTVQIGATVDFEAASSELTRDATVAGAYVGLDVSPSTKLQAYGSAGLTETSPDVGAGLRIVFSAN